MARVLQTTRPGNASTCAEAMPRSLVVGQPLSLRDNILWNSGGSLFASAVYFFISIAIVPMAGYAEAGIFSLAFAVGNVFFIMATYSMRAYQVTDVTGRFSRRDYISARLVTSGASVVAGLAFVVSSAYPFHSALAVFFFVLVKAVDAVSDVLHGIMQTENRMDFVGKSLFVRGLLALAAFFAAIFLPSPALGLCLGLLVGTTLVTLLYDLPISTRLLRGERPARGGRVVSMLAGGLPLAASGVVYFAANALPRYLLEQAGGTRTLGVYAALFVPVMAISMIASYVFNPAAVRMAEDVQAGDAARLLRTIIGQLKFIGILTACCVAVASFAGRKALEMAYGPEAAAHQALFIVLTLCGGVQAVTYFLGLLLILFRVFWPVLVLDTLVIAAAWLLAPTALRHDALAGAVWLTLGTIVLCGLGRLLLFLPLLARLHRSGAAEQPCR